MADRQCGFYWVMDGEILTIAQWYRGTWMFIGDECSHPHDDKIRVLSGPLDPPEVRKREE